MFLFAISAHAKCVDSTESTRYEDKEVSRVNQPKALEGATILVGTKDGQVYQFPADEYMVVKRVKTTKTINVKQSRVTVCGGEKNELVLGARKDHTTLSASSTSSSAVVRSEKGLVLDATYIRKDLFKEGVGAGLGIDTNGTPKAVIGIEF